MLVPDPPWLQRERSQRWYDGDTANFSIGQGALQVSPLQMACFTASVARGETSTVPTLVHDPLRPRQRTEPIGLTPAQRSALLDGMEGCVTYGTASRQLTRTPAYRVPATVVGKTGTAQITGNKNIAWFICFAPRENPEIALAVAIYGEDAGEEYAGGEHAAPVASAVLRKYFEKKAVAGGAPALLRSE
jgi:penicillin-binding protein 2